MENKIYNQSGKEVGKVTLPDSVFGLPENMDLLHQVVISMQSNARTNVAHTKGRGEVRGGGKKPWKQKGTGRARHGSNRSPIWVGGGVTHGPTKDRNYTKKINKKMKAKALYTALSGKLNDNEILFVDSLSFTEPKTSKAGEVLKALAGVNGYETLGSKKNNTALITTLSKNENVYKSFSNFGNVAIEEVRNLNVVDLLSYKYLIVVNPEESINLLSSKLN